MNWKAGDEVVVTSSDFDSDHYELLTINSVDESGLVLQLTSQLQYTHYGDLQTYEGRNVYTYLYIYALTLNHMYSVYIHVSRLAAWFV